MLTEHTNKTCDIRTWMAVAGTTGAQTNFETWLRHWYGIGIKAEDVNKSFKSIKSRFTPQCQKRYYSE